MYRELRIVGFDGSEQLHIIRTNLNGNYTSFPADPANTDYQEYLTWLDEGNTPEPADEPTQE